MALQRRQEPVNAGDTYLVAHPYNHLHVVCSDPAADTSKVLLVSITTFRPKEDESCILGKGDHPFINHKSCMRYKDARVASVAQIRTLLNGGQMTRREPVSGVLLARIRDGAGKSDFLPEECRRLLQSQGLIPASESSPEPLD
jgi:hypothetical protein